MPTPALDHFHPLVARWFAEEVGAPTDVQARAWPAIAAGKHVLATAPTGSGKTLAAFLWAMDRLITGAWTRGNVRVLYVSPLKALNNDVQKNLLAPLNRLEKRFADAGQPFRPIGVQTRSGDTPQDERTRMLRKPPEILITTPESLNILLTSRGGRGLLAGVNCVIIDEVHAIAASKRGTHLFSAIERLVLLSGEFQRIALSATVRPLEQVAALVGGFLPSIDAEVPLVPRPVEILRAAGSRPIEIRVVAPEEQADPDGDGDFWWRQLAAACRAQIEGHASTLFFCNSRRFTEKLARYINEDQPEELAWAHHGALARELRLVVERRMKAGELKAIVSTSTLELGIDIGDLDLVVLVQTPRAVSSALQRIGRSGHGVGQTSRGLLYPVPGIDLAEAAVMARAVLDRDIEEVRIPDGPLDVLSQVLLSMIVAEAWELDRLYAAVRCSYPYRELTRRQFDIVLDLLAGRYASTRLRELSPKVSIDLVDGTVRARDGAARLLYMSGGTIPDRGLFDLRIEGANNKIGELDEEFVWERGLGDTFALGSQVWRIVGIDANDVRVLPVKEPPGIIPFWKQENLSRDWHFSDKLGQFLHSMDGRLAKADAKRGDTDDGATLDMLVRDHAMDRNAAIDLVDFLRRQRTATRAPLPHRKHLLVEHYQDPENKTGAKSVLLHTLWGGRVNQPLALALAAAWKKAYGYKLETFVNNDAIALLMPHEADADILSLVTTENLEGLLRGSLESSGFFGAMFRENAGRALLLPRADFKKRIPLWVTRLRAKKLFDAVLSTKDFPILLETWRNCLVDEFDLETLRALLIEVASGEIEVTQTATREPSPFADGILWRLTNKYMYADDTPEGSHKSSLADELIRELVHSTNLRPKIPAAVIAALEAKLQRTAPGWAPRTTDELLDWVRERLLIPETEWDALLAAVNNDGGDADAAVSGAATKLAWFALPDAKHDGIVALENVPLLCAAFAIDPAAAGLAPVAGGVTDDTLHAAVAKVTARESRRDLDPADDSRTLAGFLRRWLAGCGPVAPAVLVTTLGIDEARLADALGDLASENAIVVDQLSADASAPEVCETGVLETLLRMARRASQPVFSALPVTSLPLFLATWQGLAPRGGTVEALQERLAKLFGYPAPAAAWEEYMLPARLAPYWGNWLDGLFQGYELTWFGCGPKKLSFAFVEELERFREHGPHHIERARLVGELFPDSRARYGFFDLAKRAKLPSDEAAGLIWDLAWQGLVTNDSFVAVRRGLIAGFTAASGDDVAAETHGKGFRRWSSTRPLAGHWSALPPPDETRDALDEEELVRDRARVLLERYGVLFRELVQHELPALSWARVFRALRMLELSGEIVSGYFFEGVPGLQFASTAAMRSLRQPLPDDEVWWCNACDPVSPCSYKLDALKNDGYPARLPTTWLSFRGGRLILVAKKNGKELEIRVPADDPRLPENLALFKELVSREAAPLHGVLVEMVNGVAAKDGEYAAVLLTAGFRKDYKGMEMRRYLRPTPPPSSPSAAL